MNCHQSEIRLMFSLLVFLLKYDGSTAQIDLNTLIEYNRKFWGGLSYRFQETAAVMIGVNIKDLSIGYSYDIPLTTIGGAGSHEVMVRYCFQLELEKTKKVSAIPDSCKEKVVRKIYIVIFVGQNSVITNNNRLGKPLFALKSGK